MANRVPLILNTSLNQIQELPTGDNLDLSNSGINNAGVITATNFSGDGSGLSNLPAGNASGLTGTPDITVGNITANNISIASTLTYEDVTNVDSVGVVTARQGVDVVGAYPITLGTGTTIHASANNTLSLGTLGSERLRIDQTGVVKLYGDGGNNSVIYGHRAGNLSYILGNQSGTDHFNIKTWQSSSDIIFSLSGNNEKVRITSAGDFGVGTDSPTARLDVRRGDADGKIAEFHQNTGYGIDIGSSVGDAYISSGYTQNFIIKTDPSSGQVERLRITSTGLVGIGTDDPGSPFEVNGGSALDTATFNSHHADGVLINLQRSGTNKGFLGSGKNLAPTTGGVDDIGLRSNANLIFTSGGGTERLRITSTGGFIFKGGPLQEKVKITAGKLSDNTTIDLADGNVHYFTTQESTTSTPNLRVNSTTTLDSVMAVGETIAVTIITTAVAGGYSDQLQIDSSNVTESWVGGSAPTAGGSSGVDIYNYTIIKTAANTYTVIANLTKTS